MLPRLYVLLLFIAYLPNGSPFWYDPTSDSYRRGSIEQAQVLETGDSDSCSL